jgi:hypothetical protein
MIMIAGLGAGMASSARMLGSPPEVSLSALPSAPCQMRVLLGCLNPCYGLPETITDLGSRFRASLCLRTLDAMTGQASDGQQLCIP